MRLRECVYHIQNLKPAGTVSSLAASTLTYSKTLLSVNENLVTWMNFPSIIVNEMSQTQEYVQCDSFPKNYVNRQN